MKQIKKYIVILFSVLLAAAPFTVATEKNTPATMHKNPFSEAFAFDDEDDWEIISPSDYDATIHSSTFGKDDFVIKNKSAQTWLEVVAIISPDDDLGRDFRLRSQSTTRPGEEIKWKSVYNFHGKLGQIILVARIQ